MGSEFVPEADHYGVFFGFLLLLLLFGRGRFIVERDGKLGQRSQAILGILGGQFWIDQVFGLKHDLIALNFRFLQGFK